MTGAWDSGHYADPTDPLNRDAWDVDGDGTIEVNPSERQQRFYFPPPTMQENTYVETAQEVAGAVAKQSDMTDVKGSVAGQEAAITQLQAVSAAARATQAWLSPDIQDMVSFPYYLMQPIPRLASVPSGLFGWESRIEAITEDAGSHYHTVSGGSSFNTTGNTSAAANESHNHQYSTQFYTNTDNGGSHYHVIDMVNPAYSPGSKTIEFSVIVVDRFAYLDQFKFCSGVDTSIFTINSMLASLYALNPQNGNIEKIWASPELKGSYTQKQKMYAVDLTAGGSAYQQCTPGQVLFAAVWQDASGWVQGPRSLGCTYTPMYEVNTKSWLKTGAFTLGNQNTMPSSIPYTSLVPNYNRQFWASITTG